jgi:16S rRNA (cytidine1402-2'-O)-methyltransferase
VARELTKTHEELVIGPISGLLDKFMEPKGEFTVLVPPAEPQATTPQALPKPEDLRIELGQITEMLGLRGRAALKILAERYGIPVNDLYTRLTGDNKDGQKT